MYRAVLNAVLRIVLLWTAIQRVLMLHLVRVQQRATELADHAFMEIARYAQTEGLRHMGAMVRNAADHVLSRYICVLLLLLLCKYQPQVYVWSGCMWETLPSLARCFISIRMTQSC